MDEDALPAALEVNALLKAAIDTALQASDPVLASVLLTVQGALLYNKIAELHGLVRPWNAQMLEQINEAVLVIPKRNGR